MWWFEKILIWNLMTSVVILGQPRPNTKLNSQSSLLAVCFAASGLKSDCVGSLMRLSLDKALAVGNQLEVEALNGSQHIMLTPSLAAKCGYSMESDPWGNTRIYTSLLGCYVDNNDDAMFSSGLKLSMYRQGPSDMVSHDVTQTCSYNQWASREVLCDRNYMEVSHYISSESQEPKGQVEGYSSEVSDAVHGIWKMTFFTPEPVVTVPREGENADYSLLTTKSRLVVRSPYNTGNTYSEDVAGIPMQVFRVSVYNREKDDLSVVTMAASCPTGGVLFSDDSISWHVPRRLTPLISGGSKIIEMHMGINGQRLDKSQMAARRYTLSLTDFHIVIEIPLGSPDGYYKSHAPDNEYSITYTVEPMLEVLWREDSTRDDVKYKVLFPITTPLMSRPPSIDDETDLEAVVFNAHVGPFLDDVLLKNVTFSTGVLTVDECNANKYLVQEHILANGSKSFSLQVAFQSDVVQKHNPEPLVTTYTLSVVFGFVIMPERTTFSYPVELQASLNDVVMPTLTGTCDHEYFYISIKYGSQGKNFQTMVGSRELTPKLAEEYKSEDNGTHFDLMVPYASVDAAFELVTSYSLRARLDVLLWDSNNQWTLDDLYLSCSFPLMTTTCYPNGTIIALAVKLESVPHLTPSWLTLKDKSCKPVYSNDRFARFHFSANSCGTTRSFIDDFMLYENEIGLFNNHKGAAYTSPVDPEYRQSVYCYYTLNKTESFAFSSKPRDYEPKAEIGVGQLMVQMRLAHDSSYKSFYHADEYPVVAFLKQELYFEVELMQSSDPKLELLLENCWANLYEDRMALPSWDIIVDGCENSEDSQLTVFHPVTSNDRIEVPAHVKRFSMKMFTFLDDQTILKNEIYIHCDAVICDKNSPSEGSCKGQCPMGTQSPKHHGTKGSRQRRSTDSAQRKISSGPIVLLNPTSQ